MRSSKLITAFQSLRTKGVFGSFVGAVVMSLAAVFLLAASAPAQTRTWDQGNGDWDTTTANWTGSTWADGNTAIFGGTAGSTISLTAPISATGLTFNVGSDVVTGNTLTLTGTPVVTVGSGLTATVNSVLAGTAGMAVEGGGTVNFGGDNSLRSSNSTTGLIIGQTSANNTVNIGSGGKFFGSLTTSQFRALTIGGSTFGGNVVNFSTPGTLATPTFLISGSSSQLNMGVSSSNNQLNVSNGAYVLTQGGTGGTGTWTIGTNAGADNNSISVSGTGSVFRNALGAVIHVGNAGSSNTFTVSAGGTWHGTRAPQMGAGGGDNNSVTFTGSNSLCYMNTTTNAWFQIGSDTAGVGATGNNFDVLAGAKMNLTGTGTTRTFSIGQTTGSDTSRLRISGTGSNANVNFALPIGVGIRASGTTATAGGNSNRLDVYDGGSLTTVTPIYVGSSVAVGGADSTNNSLSIGNGTSNVATVTVNANVSQFNTAAGYDGVWVVPGTTTPVTPNATSSYTAPGSGVLATQGVFLNGSTTTLNFNNGRLVAGASSAAALVSGSGTVNLNGPAYVSTPILTSTISSLITGTGSFTKEGTGLLTLNNASNNYTGNTIVSAGTLSLSTAGTPWLSDLADVSVAAGAILDLSFSGTDTISALYLGGVQVTQAGTWGSSASAATNINDTYFTGTGMLNVTSAVPEPETLGLLGVGMAAFGFLHRRRRRA